LQNAVIDDDDTDNHATIAVRRRRKCMKEVVAPVRVTCLTRSRFRLNVSAGSQKRSIHGPEGRDEALLVICKK
jgi:hypothetical protein